LTKNHLQSLEAGYIKQRVDIYKRQTDILIVEILASYRASGYTYINVTLTIAVGKAR